MIKLLWAGGRVLGLLLVSKCALGQPDPFPHVATSYLVTVNGSVLWERLPDRKLYPASLTKLMTALLVMENYRPRQIVEITPAAAAETGMKMGIRAGQKFYLEDLLAAALISSANDACHALADAIAGSEAGLVRKMNERVRQLGMNDTRFTNACGHDNPAHYSTARDLAILSNEILKYVEVTAIASRTSATISTADGSRTFELKTRNALLGRYPGALGLKTGYTPKAGKCLIAHVERNGNKVLLVMLHGHDRWWDAADILDIAFAQMRKPD